MSKKIVIDKEKIDFVTLKKLRRYFGDNDKTLFEQRMYNFIGKLIETFDSATEIDTDQSIEERAEKKYPDAIVTINLAKKMRYIEGATEQDLISKAREGEFDKLIKERIKQLNEADSEFCKDRWDMSKHPMERSLYREESNKVTFARQELETILKLFNQFTNK